MQIAFSAPMDERTSRRLIVAAILSIQTALLAWESYCHSPVINEIGHLPAGISHWQFGRFDLYRVNPPLVRMVAALPVLLANPRTDWGRYDPNATKRSEANIGNAFVDANRERTFWLYTIGRWVCIPFSWIGACVCYSWSRDLYGVRSGLTAMALWCFCPNILGNSSLMMPDAPAASLGAVACYTFWRWLKDPTWSWTISAGIVLGLAELTKTTLIVFYAIWPVLWIIYRWSDQNVMSTRDWLRETGMLASRLIIGLYIVNLGYGFEGSLHNLGDFSFKSHALTGTPDQENDCPGNRFNGTCLASLPVPLPKNYVQGIDAQKFDFEHGMLSYLQGQWNQRGWWYFYLYALTIKVPLGTWVMVILATLFTKHCSVSWRDELVVLVPLLVILIVVSSQSGFSIHFRYVLPMFPFLFIWASKAAILFAKSRKFLAAITAAALSWSIFSSLWYYPHSLSYFNEIVGGPEHGHEHLLDSSTAWGQDLLFVASWVNEHPHNIPLYLATYGSVEPRYAGISDYLSPPPLSDALMADEVLQKLPKGWYIIDVNYLNGATSVWTKGFALHDKFHYGYFRHLKPVGRIGYTHLIYHVQGETLRIP